MIAKPEEVVMDENIRGCYLSGGLDKRIRVKCYGPKWSAPLERAIYT